MLGFLFLRHTQLYAIFGVFERGSGLQMVFPGLNEFLQRLHENFVHGLAQVGGQQAQARVQFGRDDDATAAAR